MVQRQPVEIWWMHRKHLLPWLTGAQKIPHRGASRQEHGLCALLTDPIWASFLCLEPLHWAPNICSWDPRAFAFEVPFAKNVLPWSYLSQDQFLLTTTISGQISLSPTDLSEHPVRDPSLPSPATLCHITEFSFLLAPYNDVTSSPLLICWLGYGGCFPTPSKSRDSVCLNTPLHPYVLTLSLAHGGCSIHLC